MDSLPLASSGNPPIYLWNLKWILIIHQLLLYGERESKKEGKEIKRHRVDSDVMKFSIIQRHLWLSHRMPNVALTCWRIHSLMEKTSKKTQIAIKLCCCLVSQSWPAFLWPHDISQATILALVAVSSSRSSSWPKDGTWVPCIDRRVLYHWTTKEAHYKA